MSAREQQVARAWSAMSDLVLARERRREVSDELGLSFFRTKVLRRLRGGPVSMRDLAGLLMTDKAYLSVAVDDLEGRGLLVRSVDPDDRRVRLLTLTAEGERVAARADAILARPPAGFAALSDADVASLDRILGRLSQ